MHAEKTDSRIEKIRTGILLASGDVKKTDIASALGCAPTTISTLIADRRLGPDLQDAFEAWLRKNGYWPADIAPPGSEERKVDAGLVYTAKRLEALSEYILDPDTDDRSKVARIKSTAIEILEGFGIDVPDSKE
jgi:hypothetical protein